MYTGEAISLFVAVTWTVTALFSEVASKRLGAMPLNVIRMFLSLVLFVVLLFVVTGVPYPAYANREAWLWLSLSGLVGYVLGDYCLFNSYILIGSRLGQLLMTLAPPSAAIFGFFLLNERMSVTAIVGMLVTILGICISLYNKGGKSAHITISRKGLCYGIGAGVCQGVGLVLSANGLQCYQESLIEQQMTDGNVLLLLPFAATAIRSITGLAGFSIWAMIRGELKQCATAIRDTRGMLYAVGATLTGPFIGVSLSLMATQYTSAGVAQSIMSLTPILIILPSKLLFKEQIRFADVIGACISVYGVSLFFS